jgi:hypothetical protein
MVVRGRQLSDMLDDIRWQSDQLGAIVRNDDPHLTRALNQSIQRWREWVSEQGHPLYLVTHTDVLPVGPANGNVSYGTIDMSSWTPVPVHVYQMELRVSNTVINLSQIPYESRNDYQGRQFSTFFQGVTNSQPAAFFRLGQTLNIVPPSQASYTYTVYYLPLVPDLVNPTDVFDGESGWEEWLSWDVLVKLIVRDKLPDEYQIAVGERDRIQADILQRLRQDRPSVSRRRNDRARRQGRFFPR